MEEDGLQLVPLAQGKGRMCVVVYNMKRHVQDRYV